MNLRDILTKLDSIVEANDSIKPSTDTITINPVKVPKDTTITPTGVRLPTIGDQLDLRQGQSSTGQGAKPSSTQDNSLEKIKKLKDLVLEYVALRDKISNNKPDNKDQEPSSDGQATKPSINLDTYTIQPGDNLTRIALKNNTSIDAIMSANKGNPAIKNQNLILAGGKIKIPKDIKEHSNFKIADSLVESFGYKQIKEAKVSSTGGIVTSPATGVTRHTSANAGRGVQGGPSFSEMANWIKNSTPEEVAARTKGKINTADIPDVIRNTGSDKAAIARIWDPVKKITKTVLFVGGFIFDIMDAKARWEDKDYLGLAANVVSIGAALFVMAGVIGMLAPETVAAAATADIGANLFNIGKDTTALYKSGDLDPFLNDPKGTIKSVAGKGKDWIKDKLNESSDIKDIKDRIDMINEGLLTQYFLKKLIKELGSVTKVGKDTYKLIDAEKGIYKNVKTGQTIKAEDLKKLGGVKSSEEAIPTTSPANGARTNLPGAANDPEFHQIKLEPRTGETEEQALLRQFPGLSAEVEAAGGFTKWVKNNPKKAVALGIAASTGAGVVAGLNQEKPIDSTSQDDVDKDDVDNDDVDKDDVDKDDNDDDIETDKSTETDDQKHLKELATQIGELVKELSNSQEEKIQNELKSALAPLSGSVNFKNIGDPNNPSSSNYTNQMDRASDITSSQASPLIHEWKIVNESEDKMSRWLKIARG